VWSAPSTDNLRRQLATLALLVPLVLVAGTDAATARSWSSVDELAARSGFARNDLIAPTTPSALALTSVTATTLSLSWKPSRDNRRLKGYVTYRDDTFVVATSRVSTTFHGLACGRTYRLGVAAFDAAGNESDVASLSASTTPCPDTLAPTQPANLTQTGATGSTISLFWSPSLDDVSVAGYGLYRDGVRIGTATGTSFVVEGLACGTSYLLGIDSYDSAGNRSAVTSVFTSTSACPVAAAAPTSSPPPSPAPTPPPPTPPSPAPTPPPPTPPPSTPPLPAASELGVFRGSANPDGVQAFGTWLGRQPTMALDYLESWSGVDDPAWWVNGWANRYKVVYSIQLVPASGGSLQQGAAGAYNFHFANLGRRLVELGDADAILRLGWEFNGEWMPWNARGDPAAFAAYWRQIVNTMRSVPGQQFKFDWCPAFDRTVPDAAYPGDAYVDYIGLDVYDPAPWYSQDPGTRWNQMLATPAGGLNWHRDFARAHGKPMSFPEWGLWGVDNPYFIERMHDWIRQNNVAYHAYFDVDAVSQHRLAHFPEALARFRALFAALP
jgi:chitodextrinase